MSLVVRRRGAVTPKFVAALACGAGRVAQPVAGHPHGLGWLVVLGGVLAACGTAETPEAEAPAGSEGIVSSTPPATFVDGYTQEVETWRRFCKEKGDPVTDIGPQAATGAATGVAFDDRTVELGLPGDLVTSSASAGTLGDRTVLFVPGAVGATRVWEGEPRIELFVKCGQRFHAAGLSARVAASRLGDLLPREALTSGVWDADGDGRNDLILPFASDAEGVYYVSVLYNEGGGQFRFVRAFDVFVESTINTVTPVDFNHDGVLDMYASMMGEDFHSAVAGLGDTHARDEIVLFGANRHWTRMTGRVPGLTGPGDLTTFSFVCVPPVEGRRRKHCWIGTGHVRDYILEEVAPLDFRLVEGDLPPNSTMGVTSMETLNGASTVFFATNIGRPLAVEVGLSPVPKVTSEQLPMARVVTNQPAETGPDRGRVSWGAAAEPFNNSGCPGLVIGSALINSLSWLPIYKGSGLVYYERDCRPEAPDGTTFVDRTETAGPAFGDLDLRDYFQTLVVHGNDDLCPDLLVTTYPRDPDDVNELLLEPTPMRLLVNRCDTPGQRVAFRLVPEDYDARVVVTLDDGTELHDHLSQPSQAGTNGTTISFGLGTRKAVRACVHWGRNSRWPDLGPTCIDNPSTQQITTVSRAPEP